MTCMDRATRARTTAGVFISLAALQLTGCTATAAPEGAAPKVVATEPAAGATVPAGPFKLKVTFDQKMMANSYSFVVIQNGTFPPCQKTPTISADGMSFSLDCTLEAGRSYALGFNGGSYVNFKNEASVAAVPYELHFSTAP
jgi:methionine-rich copper-binding protein CopC